MRLVHVKWQPSKLPPVDIASYTWSHGHDSQYVCPRFSRYAFVHSVMQTPQLMGNCMTSCNIYALQRLASATKLVFGTQ